MAISNLMNFVKHLSLLVLKFNLLLSVICLTMHSSKIKYVYFLGNTMSGWFPVYDTMHGIRGEVNVIVKVELFSDFNKFRQSSCGVQFFNCKLNC